MKSSSKSFALLLRRRLIRGVNLPSSKRHIVGIIAHNEFGSALERNFTAFTTKASPSLEESETKQSMFDNPEKKILKNALNHVKDLGWTIEAVAAGARDVGYPSVAHGMFSRGPIELVDYFMDSCHDQLKERLLNFTDELQKMSVSDRLKFGVRSRLELMSPFIESWPQAMALGALPQNGLTTSKKLSQLADEIWYFAGDKSTDLSWYSKRALLVGIYASTELFMLSDTSPNFEETWKFLDRRVEETIALGDLPQTFDDVAGMISIGAQAIFSAATSLAGPLGTQIIRNSPLSQVPNPISTLGSVPNPFQNSSSPFVATENLNNHDLMDIDRELEKFGGQNKKI